MKSTLLWGSFRVFCFGSVDLGLTFCLGCEHNMDLEAVAGWVEIFGDFVFFTGVKDVVFKSFEAHSLEFLASQIQKEDFIDVDPSVFPAGMKRYNNVCFWLDFGPNVCDLKMTFL